MTVATAKKSKTRAATSPAATSIRKPSLRAPSPQRASCASSPIDAPPAGAQLPDGHFDVDAQLITAVGTTLASGQSATDAQVSAAAGTPSSTSEADQLPSAAQRLRVGPLVDDPHLIFLCRTLDDIEGQRKSTANRLRILTATDPDDDGVMRGFGLTEDHPSVSALTVFLHALEGSERQVTREIERTMKVNPLGPWIMAQKGVGLKQAARLLAATGDPYWNALHNRPRTVSELWAFCGYKPGQRRRKGERANWSNDAKMRAWNVVQSIIKAGGPWRDLWDERRAHTEGQLHDDVCVRCGPAGKPAQPGSPKSLGHLKADADRYVAKRLLREMWRESKRLHELASGQSRSDPHGASAAGTTCPDGQSDRVAQPTSAVGTTPGSTT